MDTFCESVGFAPTRCFLLLGLIALGFTTVFAFYPTYALLLLVFAAWAVICSIDRRFSAAMIVVATTSPLLLYLDRVQSALVIEMLILGACLVALASSPPGLDANRAPLGILPFTFAVYMVVNCAWGIRAGNNWMYAINELIPVLEMYACYWLALRVSVGDTMLRRLLGVTLTCIGVRGTWQLFLFATGNASSFVPPVFERAELADTIIDGSLYTKLIDPLQGVGFVLSLVLALTLGPGALRVLAMTAVAITGTVQLLSLERAEWVSTLVCILVITLLLGRRALSATPRIAMLLVICIGLALLTTTTLNEGSLPLGTILHTRSFEYTYQQLVDPQNPLQMVRLLEFGTALNAVLSSPLVGHGLGHNFGTEVFDGYNIVFVPVHNYYLNLTANAGTVGLTLFGYLALRVVRVVCSLYRAARAGLYPSLLVASFAMMLWYALFLIFHPVYSAFHLPALLGLYSGLALSRNQPY